MIVLDTNVISELFKPNPDERVIAWLTTVADDVAITSVTLAELLAGVQQLPDGARKAALQRAVTNAMIPYRQTEAILSFDDEAAVEFADVVTARKRLGTPISTADAQIAAICRSNVARCATRNTKDFDGTGVQLVNPWGEEPAA